MSLEEAQKMEELFKDHFNKIKEPKKVSKGRKGSKENKGSKGPVIAYTDGSASPNPGKGRYAYVIVQSGVVVKQFVSKPFQKVTNNRMELLAVVDCLQNNKVDKIVSDSTYVVNGITKWIEAWKQKDFKDRINADLWRLAYDLRTDVKFKHIKAHTNKSDPDSNWNRLVDALINPNYTTK
jgi:ribonuclease HI